MFNSSRFAGAAFAVASVFVIACTTSGGSGSTVTGEPVPQNQAGQKFAEKVCAAIAGCCSKNGFPTTTCQQGASQIQAEIDKDVAKGRKYDAARTGNCIAKWAAALGSCDPKNSGFDSDDDDDCSNAVRGTKPVGDACESTNDCAEGLACLRTYESGAQTTTGTCVRVKKPAVGDPCLSYSPDEKVDPQKTYGDCAYGKDFYCDPSSKTCKTKGGAGTDCAVTVGTSSSTIPSCNESSFCNYETKKCEARRPAGGDCSQQYGGSECASTTYCDKNTNKCVAKKAGGESCDPQVGNQCLYGCDKDTGKCQTNDIDRDLCDGSDFD